MQEIIIWSLIGLLIVGSFIAFLCRNYLPINLSRAKKLYKSSLKNLDYVEYCKYSKLINDKIRDACKKGYGHAIIQINEENKEDEKLVVDILIKKGLSYEIKNLFQYRQITIFGWDK